jgi:hypothetical protein
MTTSGPPSEERRATQDAKRRVEREAEKHTPDPTTKRVALEQEQIGADRSELGGEPATR